jgi:murein L,D-transpeptidase YafK
MLRYFNRVSAPQPLRWCHRWAALALVASAMVCSSQAWADNSAQELARAEKRLVEILAQIERREINEAFRAVTALTQEVPNFRAAQLLYADLLRLRTGGAPMGEQLAQSQATPSKRNMGVADQSIAPPEFYQGLKAELQQRRQAALDVPPPGMVPSNLTQLSPNVRHVIAVDASKSRMYVFANQPQGLQLLTNFYVTVGRNGVHKRAEGDQRTPLGVYFVGRQIPGERLPDLYGQGALTVNYPNDWDREQGRTGSGIWLHGVPSDQFARVPQASDGCVVLSNPDIAFLMATVDRRTPVLITEKLHWVSPQWTAKRSQTDSFTQAMEHWKLAWRQSDLPSLRQLYNDDLLQPQVLEKRRTQLANIGALNKLALDEMSVYNWQEAAGEIRIVNLHVTKDSTATVRQYWRKQAGRWQIFSEDVLS